MRPTDESSRPEVIEAKAKLDDAIAAYFAVVHDGAFIEGYIMQMVGSSIDQPKQELYLRSRNEDLSHTMSLGLLYWLQQGVESDAFGDDDDDD